MEKESIFSVCKAVCVERKWVHSVTMMFITRLHITRSCFSGGRKAGFIALCFFAGAVCYECMYIFLVCSFSSNNYVDVLRDYKGLGD